MSQGHHGTQRNQAGSGAGTQATIGSVGEFRAIEQFTAGLPIPPSVLLGVGDDAAVFDISGHAVVSTDALVEGVHFRRDWSSARDIGRKTVAVNVADLEAMGATPVALVITLSVPKDVPMTWVNDFAAGVRAEADAAHISLVGGDTTGARDITVTGTVIGQTDGAGPVTRSGARVGDVVALIGRLGWAAAGLAILSRGFRAPRAAVDSQRCPAPPYGEGRRAALAGASAMIDVSDGLLADLGHIAQASGVGINLEQAALPMDEAVETVGRATNTDPLTFVLSGGEDHALAATFAPDAVPTGWTVVGTVVAEPVGVVTLDGSLPDIAGGWDHFSH